MHLAANLLIELTKFIAGGFTNSASMISEGIHSSVDTTNQLLGMSNFCIQIIIGFFLFFRDDLNISIG